MASTRLRFSILPIHPLPLVLSVCLLLSQNLVAKGTRTEFSFDSESFTFSNITLLQNATIDHLGDLIIEDLPYGGVGRALFSQPILLRNSTTNSVLPFSTEFKFHIGGDVGSGQGLAFVMAPDNITTGQGGRWLGWLNNTNNGDMNSGHNFAVEFDTFPNPEFNDLKDNHVGVNLNSLNSTFSQPAAMYVYDSYSSALSPSPISMTAEYMYAWIEYNGELLTVTVSDNPDVKPPKPLISETVDLTGVLQDIMYVGFTSATFPTPATQGLKGPTYVYSWKFSTGYPSPGRSKWKMVIAVVSLSLLLLLLITLTVVFRFRYLQKRDEYREKMSQMTELGCLPDHYGAHKIRYKDLRDATGKFSEKQWLGEGGFGPVYKGVMPVKLLKGLWKTPGNTVEVAVKRIRTTSKQGAREFMAEVKIIGRMTHLNLVPLLGWCHHKSKGELLLVYEYMSKGSLDQLLFHPPRHSVVGAKVEDSHWSSDSKQLLHEECEQCVVHRDVKASNVMLDGDFNARLGDFVLARLHDHNQGPPASRKLAGTLGYMAPELFEPGGKATKETYVYSFGPLELETSTGCQATERHTDGKTLVDWVWNHFSLGRILDVADFSLGTSYHEKDMELVLHMGLLCSHPDPNKRPTMRHILSYLEMGAPFPIHMLPQQKPQFVPMDGIHTSQVGFQFNELDLRRSTIKRGPKYLKGKASTD